MRFNSQKWQRDASLLEKGQTTETKKRWNGFCILIYFSQYYKIFKKIMYKNSEVKLQYLTCSVGSVLTILYMLHCERPRRALMDRHYFEMMHPMQVLLGLNTQLIYHVVHT